MTLKQHDLMSDQDHVEGTVGIPIFRQSKHGQTCNRQITCLWFCRLENPDQNGLGPWEPYCGW